VTVQDDQAEAPPVLRFDAIRIATLAVLSAVAVATIGLIFYLVTFVQDQREANECYQRQIASLTTWAATAVEAGRSDRQAQRELLLSDGTIVDQRAALDRYLERLDEADQSRAAAPVPPQVCQQTSPN
jgi:hypothetical protein